MRIVVTGATGFVGQRLCRALLAEQHRVVGFKRPTSSTGDLLHERLEWVTGELTDAAALALAMDGVDAVIHVAAALGYVRSQREHQWHVNVDGTRAVVQAAVAARVPRFIHMSSVVAIGPRADALPADESEPYHGGRFRLGYFDSKARAEVEIMRAAQAGLDAVIVNPSAIFGAGTSNNSSAVLGRVRSGGGRLAPPGGLCVVAVEDVVRGVVLALHKGRRGERYILGGDNLTYAALFELLHSLCGRNVRVITVPLGAWRLLSAVAEGIDGMVTLKPPLTPDAMRALGGKLYYSSAKAESELGYTYERAASVLKRALG